MADLTNALSLILSNSMEEATPGDGSLSVVSLQPTDNSSFWLQADLADGLDVAMDRDFPRVFPEDRLLQAVSEIKGFIDRKSLSSRISNKPQLTPPSGKGVYWVEDQYNGVVVRLMASWSIVDSRGDIKPGWYVYLHCVFSATSPTE